MACKEKMFSLTVLIALTFLSCGSEEAGDKEVVVNQKPTASVQVATEVPEENATADISVNEEKEEERPELLEIYVEPSEEGGTMFGAKRNRESEEENRGKENDAVSSEKEDRMALVPKGYEETKPAKPKSKGRAVMSFRDKSHKYGMIMQGDKVKHDFKFTNKGTKELVVSNVSASCGCTQPSFPFIPIPPGETGVIGVVFDSTGKLGPQKSTVTVFTNAGTHKIYLEGFVDAEREKPKEPKVEDIKDEIIEKPKEEGEKGEG